VGKGGGRRKKFAQELSHGKQRRVRKLRGNLKLQILFGGVTKNGYWQKRTGGELAIAKKTIGRLNMMFFLLLVNDQYLKLNR
ncbi:hypothetical protein KCA24_16210, partial [Escherichia coli]|nr:hypothetical protein [Escherichia coli]